MAGLRTQSVTRWNSLKARMNGPSIVPDWRRKRNKGQDRDRQPTPVKELHTTGNQNLPTRPFETNDSQRGRILPPTLPLPLRRTNAEDDRLNRVGVLGHNPKRRLVLVVHLVDLQSNNKVETPTVKQMGCVSVCYVCVRVCACVCVWEEMLHD